MERLHRSHFRCARDSHVAPGAPFASRQRARRLRFVSFLAAPNPPRFGRAHGDGVGALHFFCRETSAGFEGGRVFGRARGVVLRGEGGRAGFVFAALGGADYDFVPVLESDFGLRRAQSKIARDYHRRPGGAGFAARFVRAGRERGFGGIVSGVEAPRTKNMSPSAPTTIPNSSRMSRAIWRSNCRACRPWPRFASRPKISNRFTIIRPTRWSNPRVFRPAIFSDGAARARSRAPFSRRFAGARRSRRSGTNARVRIRFVSAVSQAAFACFAAGIRIASRRGG